MQLRSSLLYTCAMLSLSAGSALAQSPTISPATGRDPASTPQTTDSALQEAASGRRPRSVDEIVVTAQKRTQNLQDVPIVVTTVSAQALQDAGVKDIKDLTVLTPGLMVTSTSSEVATTARIRGVGTVGDNLGLESSVGVVIDGVYRPRNGVGFGDLGELSRIEVLKGPQGTLFGKNTSAGVLNILTQRPSFKFGAAAEATVSNYNGYGGSVSVTGPISADKIAGRLFLAARERDGYYDVRTGPGPRDRTDDQNQNFYTIRGQLLLTPTSTFDINIITDFTKREEHCCAGVQILEAGTTQNILRALDPISGGVSIPVNPFARVAYLNRDTSQNIEEKGISAEANWKTPWFGGATLTSITAGRDWRRTGQTDPDYSTADLLFYDRNSNNSRFDQFSQELRYAGKTAKLDWLVGMFYAQERLTSNVALRYGNDFERYDSLLYSGGRDINYVSDTLVGSASPTAVLPPRAPGTTFVPGQGQLDHYDQRENNLAFFTNNNIHITSKLDLTVGVRYTKEHKDLDSLYNNTDGGLGCSTIATNLKQGGTAVAGLNCGTFQNYLFTNLPTHQELDEEEVTGTGKLSYRFNRDLLTYVSYARGYKAGGFNLDRAACPYQVRSATDPRVAAASDACTATILASGHQLLPNPQAGAGNQQSLQPVYDTSFPGEFVDSYEVGFKSTLFNRSLLFNATAFYQEYSSFQLNTFNGLIFTVVPVPEVTSTGVDTDFVWFPLKDLVIQGGLTVADTRYSPSDAAVLGPKCTGVAFGGTVGEATPTKAANPTQTLACSFLPGSRLSLAPLYSASLSANYSHSLTAGLVGRASFSAKFSSDYNTGSDLNPVKLQKAFTVVNARIGIGPENEKWELELWAQNLFDKDYIQVAFDATAQSRTYNAFLGQPRLFGATLRAKF